ncbi:MAG: cyclic nucleotide-binding domain-containing protein [Isosphaeraceae bacterium]|nr:cyclic nucleotide-binding domain-containing protein [Isosphaeraceae bacterium]
MVSTAAAERFLAAPWLSDLDATSRLAVLNVLQERREPAGTDLLKQGEPNDHISFLIEGSVAILRSFPDGRVETVATLSAPSVFGETSFFRVTESIVTARAITPVWLLTLDHLAHSLLRRMDPRAAEQLALAAVRVLAERFDLLDKRVSDYIGSKPVGHPKSTEWAAFRARLFEESNL